MNKTFLKNKTANNKNGFVILFAVLISSVVLLIAVGISNIASNEVTLSSSARESQNAFFAADTGAECALYWDIKGKIFLVPAQPLTSAGETCDGQGINPIPIPFSNGEYSFQIQLNSNKQCADVIIDKAYDSGSGTLGTKIESRGSNVPCGSTSPKAIERAVRLTY